MRDLSLSIRWATLLLLSIVLIWLIGLIRLPAATLLGAMTAGAIVSANNGRIILPRWLLLTAQAVIGCMMGRSITPGILAEMFAHWPVFFGTALAVIGFGSGLGLVLTRWQVLPGTTAIWGSSPGASTVMMLMAEEFGGDIRLVAFMHLLRSMTVASVGSIVARLWVAPDRAALPLVTRWFDSVPLSPFAATASICVICAAVGARTKLPGGPVLLALVCAAALQIVAAVPITLPQPLLFTCYTVIGWFIGLRFTRDILSYTARRLPQIAGSVLALVVLCGGLAFLLHLVTGTDVLTAYFATSPGGADSVAIIAASSHVDLPFVMTMQTTRFILALAVGPAVAQAAARWTQRRMSGDRKPPHAPGQAYVSDSRPSGGADGTK